MTKSASGEIRPGPPAKARQAVATVANGNVEDPPAAAGRLVAGRMRPEA